MCFDHEFRRDRTIGRVKEGTDDAKEHSQHKKVPQLQQVEPGQQGNQENDQRPAQHQSKPGQAAVASDQPLRRPTR